MEGIGQDGIALFKAGRYDEAVLVLQAFLESFPNDSQAMNYLAAAYMHTGRKSEAIVEMRKLVEINPDNAQNHYNLGVAYESVGDIPAAKEYYQKALGQDSGHGKARQRLNALVQKAAPAQVRPMQSRPSPISSQPLQSNAGEAGPQPPWATSASPRQPAQRPTPYARVCRPETEMPSTPPDGLNWGAFLLPFWWSIAHSAWLWTVLSFLFTPIASIFLLIKGNETGWNSRRFRSMDEFRSVQRVWTIWGLILNGAGVVCVIVFWGAIAAMFLGGAMKGMHSSNMNSFGAPSMSQSMPMQGGVSVSVTPYPGAKQQGGSTRGSDAQGSYTSITYKADATFNQVYTYFDGIASQSGNSSSSYTDSSADMTIGTASGTVRVQIQSSGNQTMFTIIQYSQ